MTADALAELIAELAEGMVVTDPAITESYRRHVVRAPRGVLCVFRAREILRGDCDRDDA